MQYSQADKRQTNKLKEKDEYATADIIGSKTTNRNANKNKSRINDDLVTKQTRTNTNVVPSSPVDSRTSTRCQEVMRQARLSCP